MTAQQRLGLLVALPGSVALLFGVPRLLAAVLS